MDGDTLRNPISGKMIVVPSSKTNQTKKREAIYIEKPGMSKVRATNSTMYHVVKENIIISAPPKKLEKVVFLVLSVCSLVGLPVNIIHDALDLTVQPVTLCTERKRTVHILLKCVLVNNKFKSLI